MSVYRVGGLDAPFSRNAGIQRTVTGRKRFLVLCQCLIAFAIEIEHAAEVNMRPCQEPRLLARRDGLLEAIDGFLRMACHDGSPRQDEIGTGAVGYCLQ